MESPKNSGAAIIPWPVTVAIEPGEFEFDPRTPIVSDKALLCQARFLQSALAAPTGYDLPIVDHGTGRFLELRLAGGLAQLGPEAYELDVSAQRITIRAGAAAGAFYAIQVLLQLMPTEIFRHAPLGNPRWRLPCIAIKDAPRFTWRGLLIDVARHFLPREFILKMLDLLALYRLNVLQLHLTDDQGWRVEIERYPRLTEIGARIDYSAIEPSSRRTRPCGQRPGGFYTQDDIREIVRYAADRCITVVPEIEMPGHAGAAILAYPELGRDGVFNVEDSTIRMLKSVLDEVIELFPSKFIHIGGDEVSKAPWKSDPRAQERMRAAGLQSEEELQSWFIKQFDSYLSAKGRRLIGWDEILEGGLAPGAAVMSWRGVAGGIAAAKAGHQVVMAPSDKTYLDAYQSRLRAVEPRAMPNYLPLEEVYRFEPIPAALSAGERTRVLGGQACLWGEYISQPKHAEYMAFPRLLAFAEAVWSSPASRDWGSFVSRLGEHLKNLNVLDVNYRPHRVDPEPVVTPIRAVLFDKDGTVVDFDRTWAPAVVAVLQRLACGDEAIFRKLSAESGLVDSRHFGPDSPIIDEPTSVFATSWAKAIGRPADAAFIREIDRLLCEATTAHLTPISDPRAVLGELAGQGYRLGLITNDAETTARAHAHKLGLDQILTFVAGYDSGSGAKPAPGPVVVFSAAVGVPPEEILMVGDTALDIATARAAGARSVLVLTGPKSSDDLQRASAEAIIASIAQLPAWLESQRRGQASCPHGGAHH